MKFQRHFAACLIGVLVAFGSGCSKEDTKAPAGILALNTGEPTEAQPKLRTIQLWLGPARIEAEAALTAREEQTGMMFRKELDENAGMLFAFVPQRASFWMKNCPLPLSVAYIDPDGVIQEIHDLEPYNTNSVMSASGNIAYALETRQGWFGRHQVSTGMVVRTERGPLSEVFRRAR